MLHHQASVTTSPLEPEPSDYDWIGELGEGGFARVSKVRYRRTGEVFALNEAFYPSPDAYEEAEVLRRGVKSCPARAYRGEPLGAGKLGCTSRQACMVLPMELNSALKFLGINTLHSIIFPAAHPNRMGAFASNKSCFLLEVLCFLNTLYSILLLFVVVDVYSADFFFSFLGANRTCMP
jgi:hypothetical protein